MQLRFIAAGDAIASARAQDFIPAGTYAALLLRISGTNDTGQTITAADFGDIRIERRAVGGIQQELQHEDLEFYLNYADLKGGYPEQESTIADAFAFVFLLPFALPNAPNALHVRTAEELSYDLVWHAALDTAAVTATWALYGIIAPNTPERYSLDIHTQDMGASDAGRLGKTLTAENIAAVYLEDAADIVDRFSVLDDGEVVIDNCDDAVVQALTNMLNKVEATGNALVEVDLMAEGVLSEALNDKVRVDAAFNAAGTLGITVLSVKFSARESQALSEADVRERVEGRVRQKLPAERLRTRRRIAGRRRP